VPAAPRLTRARAPAGSASGDSTGKDRQTLSYPFLMPDEATAVDMAARESELHRPIKVQPHIRLVHGMRHPANWLQLVRFGLVGGVGFVVNVAVYALFVHGAGFEYRIASVVAWLVAVVNNFVLNRHWTFDAGEGRAHHQAARFLAVSLAAEIVSLLLLTVFVESAHVAKVPAQALAVALSMPFNFLGNKLWTFGSRSRASLHEAP
jgi:putative flippase GtrA